MKELNLKNALIYEDDVLLAIDKPSGISVIAERNLTIPSVAGILEKEIGKVFTVHRIDKGTSGIVLFAKTAEAHRSLNQQFEAHLVKKTYCAFLKGRILPATGTIETSIAQHPTKPNQMIVHPKGKSAFTSYATIESFKHVSFVHVETKTGRTHQIRVHFASVHFPLLIDETYAQTKGFYLSSVKKNFKTSEVENPILERLSLHASSIGVIHPITMKPIMIECSLPKDFEIILKQLRKYDAVH